MGGERTEPVGTGATERPRWLLPGLAATAVGLALLALNLYGVLFASLRAPDAVGYRDFAGSVTLPYAESIARLDAIPNGDAMTLVTEATRIFHEGIAHLDPDDVVRLGPHRLHTTVPVWENYLLFALAYLKPDTYQDYEFCSYRRTLERGVGRCGQQSLALVDFLSRRGLPAGFVDLGGHTVATADVGKGEWILLDPDYGAVIPFSIAQAEKAPESVIPYYWNDQVVRRQAFRVFDAQDNKVMIGGPSVRWKRACPAEQVAYLLKWLLPGVLVFSGVLLLRVARRSGRG